MDQTTRNGEAISRTELAEMLEKYNIGKKPLAKLLGWGETTILLYLKEEELPDNEYTHRLYELYRDPVEYLKLLTNCSDRISELAARRSLEAVQKLFPHNPLFEAAEYVVKLIEKAETDPAKEGVSLLRIETILFWSQVVALTLYNENIFDEDYMPSKSGMPYRAVEERILGYGCLRPSELLTEESEPKLLSENKYDILKGVAEMFEWYGTKALTSFMDAEQYRLCGPKGARRRRVVSKDMLKKCYGDIFKQGKVKKLKDVEVYLNKRINFIRQSK